ncbi:ECF transporter S component [Bacillus sp. B1-b2]|uniref:ECF transporter S component n=1 Tax=Bacillus sp. B1-b2 TaxID=2653201 RepID=UPI0012625A7B|nr:ECF transporter S component [Bacillus sp. B1-b2]KAB7668868.1 ECF transporter S component [Bacillus sp. B1-b2]
MQKQNKTYRLALLGMLTAIIIIQTFIPFLGYIPIGLLSITIIQITVIIAAIVLGPRDGAIIGGVWGMITFIRAFTFPTSALAPIIFTNPLISVFPRVMIGIVAGLLFYKVLRNKVSDTVAMSISGVLGSLTNTILVLGFVYLFVREPYANFININVEELLPALLAIVGTNGVPEAILSGIITPIIAKPLMKIRKR